MAKHLKLLIIAGARPNFMKVAPLIQRLRGQEAAPRPSRATIEHRLVHTGQHYDEKMSDVFFSELGIAAPHINLGVGSGSHAQQTANVMTRFEPVCAQERPDWVLVVGDVNSTMACTLVCAKMGVRVAHIEAGLRSFDRSMPEEVNRLVTDALADLLLTPSPDANENLIREGVPEAKIKLVGNIMIDALVANLEKARNRDLLSRLKLRKKGFVYVTLHRPSNVDQEESLRAVVTQMQELAKQLPVVFPIHPRKRKMCALFGIELETISGLCLLEPIGYHDSLCLTENARLVLTDSGGLQEESTYFRTPCLTLRSNTERPITISVGSNKLTSLARLRSDLEEVFRKPAEFGRIPPLWDGDTSRRILDCVVNYA